MIYAVHQAFGRKATGHLLRRDDAQDARGRTRGSQAARRGIFATIYALTLDTVDLGVVLLDSDLNAIMINKSLSMISGGVLAPRSRRLAAVFESILEANRHNGIYEVSDQEWGGFVAWRLDEIRDGDVGTARVQACRRQRPASTP